MDSPLDSKETADSGRTPISIPPQEDLTEVRKPTSLLVAQFFLFPLIIIAFGVGIFVLFGSIAFDQRSPGEYLAEIRSQSGARRWQASFDLAQVITSRSDELRGSDFERELLATYAGFQDAYLAREPDTGVSEEEWDILGFLARGLGELGTADAVGPLMTGLGHGPAETRIWTIYSLGSIGAPESAPAVAEMLSHEDPGVRAVAVFVLGSLQNPETLDTLQVALGDTDATVRWNAAMSLARMDDRSGADVLLELTDRSYLEQFTDMTEESRERTIVEAVKCLALLRLERARDQIVLLSRDPNPRVRGAALSALESY
jgi:HEAT repeat protein